LMLTSIQGIKQIKKKKKKYTCVDGAGSASVGIYFDTRN